MNVRCLFTYVHVCMCFYKVQVGLCKVNGSITSDKRRCVIGYCTVMYVIAQHNRGHSL